MYSVNISCPNCGANHGNYNVNELPSYFEKVGDKWYDTETQPFILCHNCGSNSLQYEAVKSDKK